MALRRLLIAGCVVLGLGVLYLPGHSKIQELKVREARLKEEIERVKETARAFEEEIARLKNDPVYLEKVARRDLGLAREGEIVYKIIEE